MTLLAALVLQTPAPTSAADFFPLVPGTRRVYERKDDHGKTTQIDEVGKPAYFDGTSATPILLKTRLDQTIDTTYYRVDGPLVSIVGYGDDRSNATVSMEQKVSKDNRFVLLQLRPTMPVFKYEGAATEWSFRGVPVVYGRANEAPQKGEATEIKGITKLGKPRKVMGREVETIEVRAEVTIGDGTLAQTIVETSVYGRGIGLIESINRTKVDKKSVETRTTLVSVEAPSIPPKEGDKAPNTAPPAGGAGAG
jgi:hypothetical protein